MSTHRRRRHAAHLTGSAFMLAAALALTACQQADPGEDGTDDDGAQSTAESTATAGATPSPSTPASAPSSGAAGTGTESPTASPAESTALSLDMPETLSGQRVAALRQVVQLAAGPGAELGENVESPLERQASLRGGAENLEGLVSAGDADGVDLDERQQACLDATRDSLRADADAGAAQVSWFAQPATAGTTGGTMGKSAAPTEREATVQPLGVQVAVYPDEASAAAGMESAREAAETCAGTVLTGVGVVSMEPLTWPGGQGFTGLPGPETSIYAVHTSVQVGDRVFLVMQADADGGVPEDAESRARTIIAELEAALEDLLAAQEG